MEFLPFAVPEIGDDEINDVVLAMRSGWLTSGPKTKEFEANFSEYLGGEVETIAVNSATAGLHLALEAIGIGAGDEVITTTHTFTATAEVIRYLGAHPIFVDIDESTMCIDPAKIISKISPRTKAIIPVHFAGLSADMDAILKIAKQFGLRVIEDAAHALPTSYGGKRIGSLESDITVFSFYANKTITTGEGGMIATRDQDFASRMRVMRLHGISRDAFDRFTSTKPSWYYEVVAPGFKYNMTDIAASIGINQLKKCDEFQCKREKIAERYDAGLKNLPIITPPKPISGDMHSWHLYVIRLASDNKIRRDDFIQKMYDAGIGCSVHYIPLHLHPYWSKTYGLSTSMFPVSQRVYATSISLPIYPSMKDSDIDRVITSVREICDGC